jgi:hypothetical protein
MTVQLQMLDSERELVSGKAGNTRTVCWPDHGAAAVAALYRSRDDLGSPVCLHTSIDRRIAGALIVS